MGDPKIRGLHRPRASGSASAISTREVTIRPTRCTGELEMISPRVRIGTELSPKGAAATTTRTAGGGEPGPPRKNGHRDGEHADGPNEGDRGQGQGDHVQGAPETGLASAEEPGRLPTRGRPRRPGPTKSPGPGGTETSSDGCRCTSTLPRRDIHRDRWCRASPRMQIFCSSRRL
jgi:hypothetical protein